MSPGLYESALQACMQAKQALDARALQHRYMSTARLTLHHWRLAMALVKHMRLLEMQCLLHRRTAVLRRVVLCWQASGAYRQMKRAAVQWSAKHALRRSFHTWRSHALQQHIKALLNKQVSNVHLCSIGIRVICLS